MYEAILKKANNDLGFKFSVTTQPYPQLAYWTEKAETRKMQGFTLMIAIAISVIPTAMVSYFINERTKSLKHMQSVSGMNLLSYWIAHMILDIIKVLVPLMIILLFANIAGQTYDGALYLFLCFPFALVPFTYLTSFLFNQDTMAQIMTLLVHLVVGGLCGGLGIV